MCSPGRIPNKMDFFFVLSKYMFNPFVFLQSPIYIGSTNSAFYVQIKNPTLIEFLFVQANKNLDMSINASNNFNLNITWSLSSTGTKHIHHIQLIICYKAFWLLPATTLDVGHTRSYLSAGKLISPHIKVQQEHRK